MVERLSVLVKDYYDVGYLGEVRYDWWCPDVVAGYLVLFGVVACGLCGLSRLFGCGPVVGVSLVAYG